MTWALCFNCGASKFGAFNPCPECQVGSTGNLELDIAFSDHHLSPATIAAFGKVIATMRAASDDNELRFWSFLHYISEEHPSILRIQIAPAFQARIREFLATLTLPPVHVEPSGRAQMRQQRDPVADSAPGESPLNSIFPPDDAPKRGREPGYADPDGVE
jgi:hypothetical protein